MKMYHLVLIFLLGFQFLPTSTSSTIFDKDEVLVCSIDQKDPMYNFRTKIRKMLINVLPKKSIIQKAFCPNVPTLADFKLTDIEEIQITTITSFLNQLSKQVLSIKNNAHKNYRLYIDEKHLKECEMQLSAIIVTFNTIPTKPHSHRHKFSAAVTELMYATEAMWVYGLIEAHTALGLLAFLERSLDQAKLDYYNDLPNQRRPNSFGTLFLDRFYKDLQQFPDEFRELMNDTDPYLAKSFTDRSLTMVTSTQLLVLLLKLNNNDAWMKKNINESLLSILLLRMMTYHVSTIISKHKLINMVLHGWGMPCLVSVSTLPSHAIAVEFDRLIDQKDSKNYPDKKQIYRVSIFNSWYQIKEQDREFIEESSRINPVYTMLLRVGSFDELVEKIWTESKTSQQIPFEKIYGDQFIEPVPIVIRSKKN